MTAYVTEAEAETYFDGDPRAEDFLAADMAWYLTKATKIIDGLPLKGQTYYDLGATDDSTHQTHQFPRWIDGVGYDEFDTGVGPVVPQIVKDACCEEALALYLFHADTDRSERQTMKEDGVLSYSLGGDYSENMGISNRQKHRGLLSSDAYNLLKGFIGGSVDLVVG